VSESEQSSASTSESNSSSSEESESSSSSSEEVRKSSKKSSKKSSPAKGKGKKETKGKGKQDSPKKTKKRKAKKDPNAPKRATSAYFFYAAHRRDEFTKEGSKLSMLEKSKQIGVDWKTLSAKQKEPFEAKAIEDKKRYEKEKK